MSAKIHSIYAELKNRINQDTYVQGQRLSEEQLALEFNCSRTPIRQVLQKLAEGSLVKIVPKSGTYVSAPTAEELRNYLQVRAYLEGLSYRLAISSPAAELVDDLIAINQEMQAGLQRFDDLGVTSFNDSHYRFHFKIVSFTKNKLLVKLYQELHVMDRPSFVKTLTYDDIQKTQEEHSHIIDLIKNRDPTGEEFIINHLFFKPVPPEQQAG